MHKKEKKELSKDTSKQVKKGRGRPTKFSKELVKKVIEMRKSGWFLHNIAEEIGVHRQSIYNYLADHQDFFDMYAQATTTMIVAQENKLSEHLDNLIASPPVLIETSEKGSVEKIDTGAIQLHKLFVDGKKWLIQRQGKRHGVSGDVQSVEVESGEDNQVNVSLNITGG